MPDLSAAEHTVLIVEDDADIVEILRLYLEASGYRVLTALDGVAVGRSFRI